MKVNNVVVSLLGWVVRLGLLLAGLVLLASLMLAGGVLLLVWAVRALWARLTGRPVSPWTFQVNRQAVWQRFNQRGFAQRGGAGQPADDVVDVAANEVSAVSDVEPKRLSPF